MKNDPNSKEDSDLVSQLIRLKRYETPDPEYFENFVNEFQSRQRSEMLSQSARGLLVERVGTWWWSLGGKKWVYGAGAATAAVAMGAFFKARPEGETTGVEPVQVIAADSKDSFEVDLSGQSANVRPPLSTGTNTNGYIPVSTGHLQEL